MICLCEICSRKKRFISDRNKLNSKLDSYNKNYINNYPKYENLVNSAILDAIFSL